MSNLMKKQGKMFLALQQRFARATYTAHTGHTEGLSTEPIEFETKYARLLHTREVLKKLETSLRAYLKANQALIKQAKAVAKAMGTPAADLTQVQDSLTHTPLEDESLLHSLGAKIHLLNDTVKQRRKLEDLRLVRDAHAHRVDQLRAKLATTSSATVISAAEQSRYQSELTKTEHKLQESQIEYDEQLAELSEALDFIDGQTAADGPWALVATELDTFRTQAGTVFGLLTKGLFAGAPVGKYTRDPVAEKEAMLRGDNTEELTAELEE